MPEKKRDSSDRTRFAFNVEKRNLTLGGAVELLNLWNMESCFERVPDVAAQPVAAAEPDSMLGLIWMRFGVHQVAAKLSYVLEQRAVPAAEVCPEMPRRKILSKHDRTATD